MILKRRSPTMRHVSRTHRVALDWSFDRINLDTKIQIKYIDTKNQLADKLTKGNFTRDEWNHLLCLFNISHFRKSHSKVEADDEFGLAMQRKFPVVLPSTASESPEKTRHESQTPLSPETEKYDRKVRPVVCRSASHAQGHEIQRHSSESEQIRTLLDRQRDQILADCQAEIRRHEFQADYDRRSIQKLFETIESQQEELHRAQAQERRRQDHQILHEQLLKQNWDLREVHEKSLNEMEELKRVQGSTFDTKIKILSLNSLARYRNCKMKLNV